MLRGTVTYKDVILNLFASDSVESTILRLSGENAEALDILMDGNASKIEKTFRTAQFTRSKVNIERIFERGVLIGLNGEDLSSPANYRNTSSFELFILLYSIIKHTKGIKEYEPLTVENSKGFDDLISESISETAMLTRFETSNFRGSLVTKYGVMYGLYFKSDDLEIFLKEDKSFSYLNKYDKIRLIGTEVLVLQSSDAKYSIPMTESLVNSVLGIEKEVTEKLNFMDIENSGMSSYSPFYKSIDEVVKAHPDKNFNWIISLIRSGAYQIVSDATLEATFAKLNEDYQKLKILAVDTETNGLDFTFKCIEGKGSKVVGYILSAKPGTSYYFPIGHKAFDNVCDGDMDYFVENYLNPFLSDKKVTCHNNEFDWRACYSHGVVLDTEYDTMIAVSTTFGARDGARVGLKDVTDRFLHRTAPDLDDLCKNGNFNTCGGTFDELPKELVLLYGCPDADNTISLRCFFEENKIMEEFNAVRAIENESKFSSVIAYSRYYGMRLDLDALPSLREHYTKLRDEKLKELLNFIKVHAPGVDLGAYKPSSNKMNVQITYDILGYPPQYNKSGNLSLDKNAIEYLTLIKKNDGTSLYPFVSLLKEYRDLERIFTSFLDNVDKNFTEDGFCHSEVSGLVTGRLSTSKPNYQGFDDIVKKDIKARKDYIIYDMDYSSMESRVIANMGKEQPLIDFFQDWRGDYHRFQASRLLDTPQELVTDEMRGQSKGVNFGLVFGMGDRSLALEIFGNSNNAAKKKAEGLREKYFSIQPGIRSWFDNNVNTAYKKGYSETYLGNRRYYNPAVHRRDQIRRYALNQPIQGTAADYFKMGMVSLFEDIKRLGYLGKFLIIGFVHDEAVLEVHKDIHPLVVLGLLRRNMMVNVGDGGCPMYIGFGVGDSWYSAKKLEWQVGLQEELEFNIDLYDWDGDTDKLNHWAEEQIHLFNGRDAWNMIKSGKYADQAYPVNYAFSTQKFVLRELYRQYSELIGNRLVTLFADTYNRVSSEGDFVKKAVNVYVSLSVNEQMDLLALVSPKEWQGGYYNLHQFKSMDDVLVSSRISKEEADDEAEKREREREFQLLADMVISFGYRLDGDNHRLFLYYNQHNFTHLKNIITRQGVTEVENGFRVTFYDERTHKIKDIANVSIAPEMISFLTSGLVV